MAIIGLIVDFGTLVFLVEIVGILYLYAASIGFLFGLLTIFVLSEKYVFPGPQVTSRVSRFLFFGLIGILGLTILELLMWVQVDFWGWDYVASKVIATIAVFFWNFYARRTLYAR